jgi:hypothetical protein
MLKLRRTQESPEIVRIGGYNANLRDGHEPPQHSRTFPNPDLEDAKADQRPALQALLGQKRPTGHGRPIPSPAAETERRRRPGTEGRSRP